MKIEIFNNPQFGEIRTAITENSEPLFCLADVCSILGLQPHKVKERLKADGGCTVPVIDSLGRTQQATFITEPNLYKAIFQSRKAEAEVFTDWVTSDVLPSIRKTGGYILTKEDDTPELILSRAFLIATNTIEKHVKTIEEKDRQIQLKEETIRLQAPKVEYYNEVLSSQNGHTATTIAYRYNMSAVTLNRLLLVAKVIRKTGKEYSLTAPYQGKNYAVPEKFTYVNSKGQKVSRNELRWTEAGHEFIHGLIPRAKSAGVLKEVKGRFMVDEAWVSAQKNKTNVRN